AGLEGSYLIPGGSASWNVKSTKIKYVDPAGSADGITVAKAKASVDAGKSGFVVKATGASLTLPTPFSATEFFDIDTALTVQMVNSVGACWSTEFTAAKKNSATKFKAVAP